MTERDQVDSLSRWNRGEISAGALIEEFLPGLVSLTKISGDPQIEGQQLEALRRALTRSRRTFVTTNPIQEFLWYATGVFQSTSRIREEISELTVHSLPTQELILSGIEQLELLEAEELSWVESRQQKNRLLFGELEQLQSLTAFRSEPDLTVNPDSLTPDAARVMAFRLISGLSFSEISIRLGAPLSSVYKYWEAGRSILERSASPSLTEGSYGLVAFDFLDTAILRAVHEHPELLRTLQPREFERLLARALELLGYEIELNRGTKDGGVDIFAIKRDSDLGNHRYLIQAKRWKNRVGVEPVRELLFLHQHYKATKSCLATTSTFTKGAWMLAGDYSWQLELRDFERLREWITLAARKV